MPLDYDPEALQTLYEAFDAVWMYAVAYCAPLAARVAIRKRMTRRLVDAVEAGERDPEKLRRAALEAIEDGT